MSAKSPANRRPAAASRSPKAETSHDEVEVAGEDALAYEHGFMGDDEEDHSGYLERASDCVRQFTRQREGRVVVAALASGFAIGAAIGCLIASSRERKPSWTDRLACEGLGRRLLDRLGDAVPESIAERFGR
jgi:hypothetical protein